jgi:gluconolactonase
MRMTTLPLAALVALEISGQIFSPGAKLEKLYEGGHLTEGAAVGPDGAVYFSDITFTKETAMQAGHILRYDPATRKTSVYRSPSGMANRIQV